MTTLVPLVGKLTLDDLESLAFTYGGTVERCAAGWQLVGAVMAGNVIDRIGPVSA